MGVYKSKRDGTWCYRFEYKKKLYTKYGFAFEKEAKTAERSKLRELELNAQVDTEAATGFFPVICDRFYEAYASTLKNAYNYKSRLPLIKDCPSLQKPLNEIEQQDIREFRRYIKTKAKLSDLTVNHYHAHVKAVINWWIKEKKLTMINAAETEKMAKTQKVKVRFLYPAEEEILTPFMQRHPKLWPYYVIGLKTGLRLANICDMRVKDVDFVLDQIFIPVTKNGESGYIPIVEELRPYLQEWVKGKGPNDYVVGNYLNKTVSHLFPKLAKEAGVPNFTFHCLRHTYVNNLLSQKQSLYDVSKLILKKDYRSTESHYGHLAMAHLKKVANNVPRLSVSTSESLQKSLQPSQTPLTLNQKTVE